MRKLLIGLGFLVILFLAIVFIAPSLVPSETYRTRIQEQLSSELGRDVEVTGDVRLSTFPAIVAKTGAVRIANPDGFATPDFASIEGLEARIRLLPLLSRRVEIKSFTLQRPVISLEKRSDGQTNWTFSEETEASQSVEAGPFKRDGRFTTFDPAIQAFRIEDGTITYSDQTTGQQFSATEVNTFLALPGLSETLQIDGDLQIERRPLSLDVVMTSPKAFLSGEIAEMKGDIATDGAALSLDGRFPAGEAIAFQGDLQAAVSDMADLRTALGAWLPQIDGIEAIQTANLQGNIDYSATKIALSEGRISITGPAINGQYNGDATVIDGSPVLDGQLAVEISDAQRLASLLPEPIPGFDLLQTANIKADLTAEGTDAFSIPNATVAASGPTFKANFSGAGRFADILSVSGKFDARTDDAGTLIRAAKLNLDPSIEQDIALAGAVTLAGDVELKGQEVTLSQLSATSLSEFQDTRFTGNVRYNQTAVIDGVMTATVPSLSKLAANFSTDIPYADAIERITVDTTLAGPADSLSFRNLKATLQDGALNGDYEGSAAFSTTNGLDLDGQLSARGDSLSQLAEIGGTPLPPSTEIGDVFEAFSLSGKVTGSATQMALSGATLDLDDLSSTGDFSIDMSSARPKLTGTLNIGALDLRPYMDAYSAQKPEGEIQPWSEEPLPLEPLRAMDADLQVTASSVKVARLSLDATTMDVTLRNGRLEADLPALKLYRGAGNAKLTYDASQATPRFTLNAALDAVNSEGFLGAIAGFTQATGTAGTTLELAGSGRSQADLMRSLSGAGLYQLADGSLKGIDAAEFLTGLDTALQSRALPSGIGPSYTTKFRNLLGGFKIENGVATVDQFSLNALGVSAEASGQVDLGAQTIDFRFRPKATGPQANGLAAFGIPLRFSGGFGDAKASLDSDFLGEIVEAKARAEAQKLITDRVGGPVGSIVGGLIGGGSSSDTTDGSTTQAAETNSQARSQPNTGALEQVVGGLLGGGRPQENPPAAPDTPPEATEQTESDTPESAEESGEDETVEDAVLGLFGIKRGE
jgi:uncharacterized protein involved in outer membrane biogenesis